jgi:hypothetical protein
MAGKFVDFDEFKKNVSFDIVDPHPRNDEGVGVMALFSQGFIKSFDKEFAKSYPEIARNLTAYDLYTMMLKEFDQNA